MCGLYSIITNQESGRLRGLLVVGVLMLSIMPTFGQGIIGRASIIDGDTIEIHGERVRLAGIDAPETDQLCRGDDSIQYRCGAKAANELDRFLSSRPVRCVQTDVDRYGRTVAACTVDGVDLAQWLVRHGHAMDWPRYSKGKYAQDQKAAEMAGIGIWAGSFAAPWLYRDCVRSGGRPGKCSDEPVR